MLIKTMIFHMDKLVHPIDVFFLFLFNVFHTTLKIHEDLRYETVHLDFIINTRIFNGSDHELGA